MADDQTERVQRFRKYAQALRIIAAETNPGVRQSLFKVAKEYDQMATNLEKMSRARLMAER